jgi:hypothetical protein
MELDVISVVQWKVYDTYKLAAVQGHLTVTFNNSNAGLGKTKYTDRVVKCSFIMQDELVKNKPA